MGIINKIFCRKDQNQSDSLLLNDYTIDPQHEVIAFVDSLLYKNIIENNTIVELRKSDTCFADGSISYEKVVNRFKVMMSLTAQKYSETKTGKIVMGVRKTDKMEEITINVEIQPDDDAILTKFNSKTESLYFIPEYERLNKYLNL